MKKIKASRPTRARGLKHCSDSRTACTRSSRPTRARGLKQGDVLGAEKVRTSRPTRARGLKPVLDLQQELHRPVAPHAGARIETMRRLIGWVIGLSRAPRGRAD